MIATLLGASIGVPYAVSHKDALVGTTSTGTSGGWSAQGVAPPAGHSAGSPPSTHSTGAVPAAYPKSPTMPPTAGAQHAGMPVVPGSATAQRPEIHAVEQVFRFDLTRDWVFSNWSRKSIGPTDVGLLAVRVPLITGTDTAALAGSLTYYFNSLGAIEHISFRGRTGDSRRFAAFLTQTYHFQPVSAPTGEHLYQVRSGSKLLSELRARPESVLVSSSPQSSIAVELELARPGSQRALPQRPPQLQIPPAETPPSLPAATDAAAASNPNQSQLESAVNSYFDKARYATPQEQSQMLWRRWPN